MMVITGKKFKGGPNWLASYINYLLKLWIVASKIENLLFFGLFGNKHGPRNIENICKILLTQ